MIEQVANLRTMRYGNQSSELAQIQSARNALRMLDAEITKTELRLRRLPAMVLASHGGTSTGGGGLTQEQRLIDRRLPKKMRGNKIGLGPVEMGPSGVGLNTGYLRGLGGKAMTGMIGFHVTAGLLNQGTDLVDRQRQLQQQGVGIADRRTQGVLDVAGAVARTAGTLAGVTPLAGALLRAAGNRQEDVDRWLGDAFDRVFDPIAVRQRNARHRAGIERAGADVRKQYKDDNDFLNSWTPEDFDVSGDAGRSMLREELARKNRKYLKALSDVRLAAGMEKAELDARGS